MQSSITMKAYAVLVDASRTRHAVWRGRDPSKDPSDFHRLLGGHVEFGERSADAVVREIAEELGTALVRPVLLGVLENVFTFDGRPGHEVVFVYAGSLPDGVVADEGGWFDDGGPIWVEWRPIQTDLEIPLYPAGVQQLIDSSVANLG